MGRIAILLFTLLPLWVHAQTTLKISTLYPPGTDVVLSLQQIAADIKERTQGAVQLKVYPGGVMGDDKTVLRKIKIGQLHGAVLSGSGLDLITPDLKDLSQPFQFDALSQVYAQRESTDAEFRDRLADEGWRGYGPLDGGFSYLMSKEPLPDLDAVRDAKLWLPNTPDIQSMARQMNVDYLIMNIGDVLTGLDTGAVDTLISPPSAAITLNWHSRFNYFTETPVMYTWGMLVLPSRVMNKVPDDYQAVVQSVLSEWADALDMRLREGNRNAFSALEQLLQRQPFDKGDIQTLRLSQR